MISNFAAPKLVWTEPEEDVVSAEEITERALDCKYIVTITEAYLSGRFDRRDYMQKLDDHFERVREHVLHLRGEGPGAA